MWTTPTNSRICKRQTDLWGCRGGAVRSSGTGRMGRLHRPGAGSVWAVWSRSAAAPPSSLNAAGTQSKPSPPPERGWSPGGRHCLFLLRCLFPQHPGPVCRRSVRSAKGRRAAWGCRRTWRPEVWARRGWASRRCCLGMCAGRCGRATRCRRCHRQETGSWRGGRPSSATPGWTPAGKRGEWL